MRKNVICLGQLSFTLRPDNRGQRARPKYGHDDVIPLVLAVQKVDKTLKYGLFSI